jgi:hypothetical protein
MDELFNDMCAKNLISIEQVSLFKGNNGLICMLKLLENPTIGKIQINESDTVGFHPLTEDCPEVLPDRFINRRN